MLRLTGLIAAPHTPMNADASIRLDMIERQAQILVEGNVSGAFVCGTTGEGLSLSTAERMSIAERWVQVAPKSLPIVVHVGHTSVAEAKALSAHAQLIKAAAFAALAPCFFKPASVAALVEFCVQVAAAAPELPFYFYHIPGLTGANLSMVDFLPLARKRIPNLAGIKFTHADLMEYQQCLRIAGDSLDILFGRDEILLHGLSAGAKGAIGSTYNYMAPVYHKLIKAHNAADIPAARELQSQAVRMIDVLRRYGEIPVAKAVMTLMGADCGPVRSPLANLPAERLPALKRDLAELGDIFIRPLKL